MVKYGNMEISFSYCHRCGILRMNKRREEKSPAEKKNTAHSAEKKRRK